MAKIEIDRGKCEGAGECADICPAEVFDLRDNKCVPVNMDECVDCCACVKVCPNSAIKHSSC